LTSVTWASSGSRSTSVTPKACRVTAFRFGTGSHVHVVQGALVEWVSGYPVLEVRYLLACGNVRSQRWGHPLCGSQLITCPKCATTGLREGKPS
jgi:hypothetical protein